MELELPIPYTSYARAKRPAEKLMHLARVRIKEAVKPIQERYLADILYNGDLPWRQSIIANGCTHTETQLPLCWL